MPVPQKSRANAPYEAIVFHHSDLWSALIIGGGFADVCSVDVALWSTMTHDFLREVFLHVKRERVRRTGPTYVTSSKYVDVVALFTESYTSHVAILMYSWYILSKISKQKLNWRNNNP